MPQRPSKAYCQALGLPHPAPEEVWHPREFTLDRVTQITDAFMDAGYTFTSFKNFASFAHNSPENPPRLLAIAVPVCFSPSQALALGHAIAGTKRGGHPWQDARGVFFFEANSPSYKLDDPRTLAAMAELANQGHEVGLMLGIENDTTRGDADNAIIEGVRSILEATGRPVAGVTFRTVGVGAEKFAAIKGEIAPLLTGLDLPSTHDNFGTDCGIATTSNGVYKNGHPLSIIESGKPLAMLNLIECWFSRDPKWALDRLGSLPEVRDHEDAVITQYLDRLKAPVLGQNKTREVVPEFEHWRGHSGFRDGLRLQASG